MWEQSRRLISGSLVVLTPVNDMFRTTAIIATVAARPLAAITQNPPEIDLFISRHEDLDIDPAAEYVMVEERSAYFEANRHTLLALQKLRTEAFPLAEHLVQAETAVGSPAFLKEKPTLNVTSVFINNKHEAYDKVDVVRQISTSPENDLDHSQVTAMHRILTKKLAIVQGPPGTGKTFVSVQSLRVMVENSQHDDPPIIIACQTNHALDQLLRHVAKFCPDFVRLGGRSKDKDVIKTRTLYEVRNSTSNNALPGSVGPMAKRKMKDIEKEIETVLSPLRSDDKQTLDHRHLVKLGLLTEKQADSLEAGTSKWVQAKQSNPNEAARSPLRVWLGRALEVVPLPCQPEEYGFDLEDVDLEYEQLQEIEAENIVNDDEDFDGLSGRVLGLADHFTGRKIGVQSKQKLAEVLKQQDLWKIPEATRGSVYRYLQDETKLHIRDDFRALAEKYDEQARLRRVGNFEREETILREQKIIGMTTTGLSKYRGLISALQPRIVLIEEAAETLEAPVIAACMPSLQQLILVGDHKQLRPHCQVKDHENKPYYLNISLFERMINNKVEFDTLTKQRRMIPEIRRILYPIYGNIIQDHASVLNPANRPDVPGMGGVNSFFFTHQWPEQRDDLMSCINPAEADMIVGFVEYLAYNGMDTADITILTFYNGQRKRILSGLRNSVTLTGHRFTVVTVDSYQGEENKVVLLSLVRSNDKGQIGFLDVQNRVCVALSRAMCGSYIFGNGGLLFRNKTWEKVLKIVAGHKKTDRPKIEPICRLSETLPVKCKAHNNLTEIQDSSDWDSIVGGCKQLCDKTLPCGHKCVLTCHPFAHEKVTCHKTCSRVLACGHTCSTECGEVCKCTKCTKAPPMPVALSPVERNAILQAQLFSWSSKSWQSFSNEEPSRYTAAAAAAAVSGQNSRQTSPAKVIGNVANVMAGAANIYSSGAKSSSSVMTVRPKTGTNIVNATGGRVKYEKVLGVSGSCAVPGASAEEKDVEEEPNLIDFD
jgi:helicase required for RNAi-mediated heterochromatin assembly 1